MVAFTGFSNDGYNNFSNTLSNLGSNLGNAYLKNQERELLSDFGRKYASGDIEGAMSAAVAMGRPELAVDIKTKLDQRAADANVLSSINGPAISPVAQTSNPNDPRGIRNLNPGNIQDGDFAKSQPGYVGSDGRFAKFDTMDHGAAANAALLQNYGQKGLNTVEGIISRYAPPSENNTKNYIMNVAHDIGVDPRQPLNLNDPAVMGKLQQSIFKIENGQNFNIGGQPQRVQVADASGAIPQSAGVDGLMARRNEIMRRMAVPGISDNARQQLKVALDDTTFQIQRADTKAAVIPEFQKKNEAKMADRFDAIVNEGDSARSEVALVDQLDQLGQSFQTGGAAAAQAWLADRGINVGKNVDQIQAYQAIVNKLVPMQRAPGSGSTSDFDAKGFMASLPSLIKTPEGNQRIIDTLKGLAQFKIERGIIAEKIQLGEMTANEGVKALRDLKATDYIKRNSSQPQAQGFNVKPSDQIPGSQPTMQSDRFQKSNANVPQGFDSDFADFQRAVTLHPERRDEFLGRLAQKYKNNPSVLSQIK